MSVRAAAAWGTIAVGAAAGFLALEHVVAHRQTSHLDGRARRRFPKRRRRITKAIVTQAGYLGKPYVHAPLAIVASALLWRRSRSARTGVVGVASLAGTALSKLLERTVPHRSPPPGRRSPSEPSFPSGHTLETAAVSITAAWVIAREGALDARMVAPLAALIPAGMAAGRLYLDRHWITDTLGGALAGIGVGALCVAAYELLPE